MGDVSPERGALLWFGLLVVGVIVAPIGWLLVAFAAGTRCHPGPCPSPTASVALLGIALVGTLALGIGGIGSARHFLQTLLED